MFHRGSRTDSIDSELRPMSARSGLSFAHRNKPPTSAHRGAGADNTEEERLGLVKGDSRFDTDDSSPTGPNHPHYRQQSATNNHLRRISSDSGDDDAFYGRYGSPPTYSDLKDVDIVEDPDLGVLGDGERWTVPMPAGLAGASSSSGHSRNLTGGGLGSAPQDVRVPAPGVSLPGSPGRGSSSRPAGTDGYQHARGLSDSSDDFMAAVRKL